MQAEQFMNSLKNSLHLVRSRFSRQKFPPVIRMSALRHLQPTASQQIHIIKANFNACF